MKVLSIYSNQLNFGKTFVSAKNPAKTKIFTLDAYTPQITVNGNKQQGYTFYVDYVNAKDEEKLYTFKPDGSATCRSTAWGITTSCPSGTFSDVYAQMPNSADRINDKSAMDMVNLYKNTYRRISK